MWWRIDTYLPRCVTRLPTAFTAIIGHPPVLAGVPRQRDLLLNLAANLVPKVRAAAIKTVFRWVRPAALYADFHELDTCQGL